MTPCLETEISKHTISRKWASKFKRLVTYAHARVSDWNWNRNPLKLLREDENCLGERKSNFHKFQAPYTFIKTKFRGPAEWALLSKWEMIQKLLFVWKMISKSFTDDHQIPYQANKEKKKKIFVNRSAPSVLVTQSKLTNYFSSFIEWNILSEQGRLILLSILFIKATRELLYADYTNWKYMYNHGYGAIESCRS